MIELQNIDQQYSGTQILWGCEPENRKGFSNCNYGPKWCWQNYVAKRHYGAVANKRWQAHD